MSGGDVGIYQEGGQPSGEDEDKPAAAVSSPPPKLDRYGFIFDEFSNHTSNLMSPKAAKKATQKEALRTRKWQKIFPTWDNWCRKNPKKLKERVRKGIPDSFRGEVWFRLAKGPEARAEFPAGYYTEKAAIESPCTLAINTDLNRTFPDHVLFRKGGTGQGGLYRVLNAYANHDPQTGYCQGMPFIAALLLLYMPEEQAFWTFVCLLQREPYAISSLYSQDMYGSLSCFYQVKMLCKKHEPKVLLKLEQYGLDVSMFASHWFITLYASHFPVDKVLRIWDIMFLEGFKVIFRFALGALRVSAPDILSFRDMEPVLLYYKDFPRQVPLKPWIKVSLDLNIKREEIARHAESFKAEHSRTQAALEERRRSLRASQSERALRMAAEEEREKQAGMNQAEDRKPAAASATAVQR